MREKPSTIDLLAKKLAAMRSKAPFPRVVRMTAKERTRAYGYLIALVIGDREELQRRSDDVKLLERMTGLRSGHGDGLAHMSPLNTDIARLLPLLSVEDICEAINHASDEEYEFVRRTVRTVVLFLPLLFPLMRSSFGQKGVALVDASRQLFSDPPAVTYQALTLLTLLSLKVKATTREEIRQGVVSMNPDTINAEIQALLTSEPMMQAALRQLDHNQREHLEYELRRPRD